MATARDAWLALSLRTPADALIRARAGRDLMFEDGYHLVIQFLPMRSLMTREDEGRMTLVGLEVEVGARRSRYRWMERRARWRPYLRFRSDAAEIAERRASPPPT